MPPISTATNIEVARHPLAQSKNLPADFALPFSNPLIIPL
jgi:hypothetical protein